MPRFPLTPAAALAMAAACTLVSAGPPLTEVGGAEPAPANAAAYNLAVGTQTIGPAYHFTKDTALVETARRILAMGSDILKITVSPEYWKKYPGVPPDPSLATPTAIVRDEPSYRAVLDMPFRHYLLWVYTIGGGWWDNGLSEAESRVEYRQIYDLTRCLLTRYAGTGKAFLLGHWEGDWHLLGGTDPSREPTQSAVQGMIDWLKVRQKAVDDAKRDTPRRGVQVWCYTEVNLVQKAIQGRATVTNSVLPKANVDYVSYSSYDSLGGEGAARREALTRALDYVESKLPPKPAVPGKRVFIGEYGAPGATVGADQQERQARDVVRAALEWGCPYVLYWEMYCNEVVNGAHRGFWLIDDKGQEQPSYRLLSGFLRDARRWVEAFGRAHGRLPTRVEFGRAAARLLDAR
ncbi:MAG: hypothetical protein IT208_04890 [Chthonomonadales bacterium]|nr:hypothetical protein [Chthonomonadales bacterium]